MSSLKIEERFELDAHPEEVWAYLTQPELIVVCLPGAELTEVIDERNFAGRVKVKLGPVAMDYRGPVEFTEVDPEQRVIRMEGKGQERRGGGTATLTMEGTVRELEGGRSEVSVVADIRLAGKIVSFGRGMIQAVTAEVFKEFTERLADELAASGPAEAGPAGAPGGPTVVSGGTGASGAPPGMATDVSSEAVALLPLLFRSLRSWLRRLFGQD